MKRFLRHASQLLPALLALALLWVGSRARFIWLENLRAGDHGFGRHWSRFGALGNSFFAWKLGFYLVTMLVVVPLVFFGGVFGALGIAGFDGLDDVLDRRAHTRFQCDVVLTADFRLLGALRC